MVSIPIAATSLSKSSQTHSRSQQESPPVEDFQHPLAHSHRNKKCSSSFQPGLALLQGAAAISDISLHLQGSRPGRAEGQKVWAEWGTVNRQGLLKKDLSPPPENSEGTVLKQEQKEQWDSTHIVGITANTWDPKPRKSRSRLGIQSSHTSTRLSQDE